MADQLAAQPPGAAPVFGLNGMLPVAGALEPAAIVTPAAGVPVVVAELATGVIPALGDGAAGVAEPAAVAVLIMLAAMAPR